MKTTNPKGPRGPRSQGPSGRGEPAWTKEPFDPNAPYWLWGVHAVVAAIQNPRRKVLRLCASRNGAERLPEVLPDGIQLELIDPDSLAGQLPAGAVHQGLAVRVEPLKERTLQELTAPAGGLIVMLDQVTDPQNVGAIFRSAAAFGLAGVVMQTRNAPALGGALAKAATGAIEKVDEIRAVNLSRAIDALVDAGWKVIGLDGTAEQTLDEAFAGDEPLAIVMGAEGAGLRQGVAKACSGLARIPIGAEMESLNVSNAAAIAFYEAARRGGRPTPPAKSLPLPASGDDADDDGFDDEAE